MIRLNLGANDTKWIEVGGGARIKVRACEAWMRTVAQERAIVDYPLSDAERAHFAQADGKLEGLYKEPFLVACERHKRATAMITNLALISIRGRQERHFDNGTPVAL